MFKKISKILIANRGDLYRQRAEKTFIDLQFN